MKLFLLAAIIQILVTKEEKLNLRCQDLSMRNNQNKIVHLSYSYVCYSNKNCIMGCAMSISCHEFHSQITSIKGKNVGSDETEKFIFFGERKEVEEKDDIQMCKLDKSVSPPLYQIPEYEQNYIIV